MKKIILWILLLMATINIDFHEDVICQAYRPYLDDYKRYNVFYGGASSGKSVFAVAQRPVFRSISEPGRNFVILRKVDKTVRFSTYQEVKKQINEWGVKCLVNENKTDQLLTFDNGNHMLFKGMDDPEKIKSITFDNGPVTDIIMEEATEFTYEDFKQCRLRLRGAWHRPKQLTLVFNPISALHWAKKEFFDIPKDPKKASILKTTYKDNPYLDQEDIDDIEEFKKDPTFWKVYGLGEWGVLGNLVFHNYVIEEFDYTCKELQNNCYGMDFGFNHASTLIPVGFHDGEIYIWNEEYATKHTNEEFIQVINEAKWFPKRERITSESAEPDRIVDWRKAGYNIQGAKKGKGSLKRGIDFLRHRKIHIHKYLAPHTAREFQMFKYRENKDGTPMDEFVERFDDCIAGARYATEHLWTSGAGRVGKTNLKGMGL